MMQQWAIDITNEAHSMHPMLNKQKEVNWWTQIYDNVIIIVVVVVFIIIVLFSNAFYLFKCYLCL